MRAADHAQVWNRAADIIKDTMMDRGTQSGMVNALAPIYTQFRAIAQAYREEAERNPE